MLRFKVQAGKTPFKNPWGDETSWIEIEAANLQECLIKTKVKHPGVPILMVFMMKRRLSGERSFAVDELVFSTFEEMP